MEKHDHKEVCCEDEHIIDETQEEKACAMSIH